MADKKTTKTNATIEFAKLVKYPVSTEKSLKIAEAENKLIFVVDINAKKAQLKKVIEDYFNAKVTSINTLISNKGKKKAYITFSKETPAIDIATNLGML